MSRIAVFQMVSGASVSENLTRVAYAAERAAAAGAQMLCLPENFAYMGRTEQDKFSIAEPMGSGVIQDFLSRTARDRRLWIIAGSVPVLSDDQEDRVRSACLVYNAEGKCVARYDKIHLFDVRVAEGESYMESRTIAAGNEVVLVPTPLGIAGLSICYDVRFPELYRALVSHGAQILLVPSAFTQVTGQMHWEVLLRARAIENQCYVLAPNQGGLHPDGRKTFGHSMIIDPQGKIISQCDEGEVLITGFIDMDYLQDVRTHFPALKHRVLNQKE